MSHARARCFREKAWHPSCGKKCSGWPAWSQSQGGGLGGSLSGCRVGNRAGCGHSLLPASGYILRAGSRLDPMGRAFSPTSTLLGNLSKSLSISVLPQATAHPLWQIFNQQGCHLTWERCLSLFLNHKSTSQKQCFCPFFIFMAVSS